MEIAADAVLRGGCDLGRQALAVRASDRLTLKPEGDRLQLLSAVRLKRRGGRTTLRLPAGASATTRASPDTTLVAERRRGSRRALRRGELRLQLLPSRPAAGLALDGTLRGPGRNRSYLEHVADRLDLRGDIRLHTRVTRAGWDDGEGLWRVEVDAGEAILTRQLILATGNLSAPKTLDIQGVGDFLGPVLSTSSWPQGGFDAGGLRVGVIGTGSACCSFANVCTRDEHARTRAGVRGRDQETRAFCVRDDQDR